MKKYLITFLILVGISYSAEVVMFVGGTGTQAAPASYPGLATASAWVADPTAADYIGTNGAAIEADDGDGTTYTFASSQLTVISSTGVTTDMYAFVYDNLDDAGYYAVTDVIDETHIEIDTTGIDGVFALTQNDTVSFTIGGAGHQSSAGYVADDPVDSQSALDWSHDIVTAYIGTDDNGVEVLYNRTETAEGTFNVDSDSSLFHELIFTGCDIDFIKAVDEDDMPLLTMGAADMDVSGQGLTFQNLAITSSYVVLTVNVTEAGNLFKQCSIANTNASNGGGIYLESGMILNCKVVTAATAASVDRVPMRLLRATAAYNFISCKDRAAYLSVSNTGCMFIGNLIDGNGESDAPAIYVDNGSAFGMPCLITNNSISNFDRGIELETMPNALTDVGQLVVMNNTMWLTNSGTSFGIYNADSATCTNRITIINNAIGNVTAAYSGFTNKNIYNQITLTGSPFVNAGGSFLLASDFILDTIVGEGAACLNSGWPRDIDSDTIEENFTAIGGLQSDSVVEGEGEAEPTRRSPWIYW